MWTVNLFNDQVFTLYNRQLPTMFLAFLYFSYALIYIKNKFSTLRIIPLCFAYVCWGFFPRLQYKENLSNERLIVYGWGGWVINTSVSNWVSHLYCYTVHICCSFQAFWNVEDLQRKLELVAQLVDKWLLEFIHLALILSLSVYKSLYKDSHV